MSARNRPLKHRGPSIRLALRALWGALARVAPAITRPFGFYGRAVAYPEAGALVWSDEMRAPNPLTPADRRFVAERCAPFENWIDPRYPERDLVHRLEVYAIRDAVGLARTAALAVPRLGALATAEGGSTNHREDRAHWPGRRLRLDGLSAMAPASRNFFHFHDDMLLPLVALQLSGAAPLRRVVLPPRAAGFARDILRRLVPLLGIDLVEPGPRDRLSGDWLAWRTLRDCTEWTPIDSASAERLSALLRRAYDVAPESRPQRLFLDRGAAARGIRPSAEFDAFLREMRLTAFIAHSGNVGEQIARFASAEAVLAVHGAGLTNMLHMPPGGLIVEALPPDLIKSTFRMMARQLGHRYAGSVAAEGGFRTAIAPDWPALRAEVALAS